MNETIKPWYKQFWPWFIIAIPAGTVVAAMFTIYIATKGADSLVVGDYYKEGLAINVDKARQQRAAELKIAARLLTSDADIQLQFAPDPIAPETLNLTLTHPTKSGLDQEILLTRSADGIFRGPYTPASDATGWYLALSPADQEWSLQSRWYPSTTEWGEIRP